MQRLPLARSSICGLAGRHLLAAVVPLLIALAGCGANDSSQPAIEGESEGNPVVSIETTMGSFKLELDAERTPITAANFLRYVKDGFYPGTIFNHVVPDSMIVGGSQNSKLQQKFDGLRDPIPSEWSADIRNERGTIGMFREVNEPDSATAEFYINLQANPRLDQPQDGAGYAVFGRVIEGMEVVDRIGSTALQAHPGNPTGPLTVPIVPVMITKTELANAFDLASLEAENEKRLAGFKEKLEAAQAAMEAQVQDIIESTKKEFGVDFTTTESGLMHATLVEGTGPTPPSSRATVEVHYEGRLTDGKKFDSSYDRGAPATFPLNRVIPGWTEGVGSMKVGEKRRLIIPSDLGYGDRGAPPDIPGGATLVFDVELISLP